MKKLLLIIMLLFSSNLYAKLQLYAVKYGESKVNSKFIYYKDQQDKMLSFDWIFYVIKENNRVILIDCGFNAEKYIKIFKIKHTDPVSLINIINIKPANVTDLIITHHHFDHAGNILKFPNAKIYIQKSEWLKVSRRFSSNTRKKILMNLVLFEKEYSMTNNIRIYNIGSHSKGSSIVVLKNDNKRIMFLGDEFYLLDNITRNIPSGSGNYKRNKAFLNKIRNHPYIFLPSHDPVIVKGENRVMQIDLNKHPDLSKEELNTMPY